MKASSYRLDFQSGSYCVTCEEGTVASFGSAQEAYDAMRDFQDKQLPESWQKIPPAILRFKKALGLLQ